MKITVKCGVKDKHVLINEMSSIIITIIIIIIDLKILSRPYKFSDQWCSYWKIHIYILDRIGFCSSDIAVVNILML